jgi:hypothetical protein
MRLPCPRIGLPPLWIDEAHIGYIAILQLLEPTLADIGLHRGIIDQ